MNDKTSLDLSRCNECGSDECTATCTVPVNSTFLDSLVKWKANRSDYFCPDCEKLGLGGEKPTILRGGSYSATWLADKVAKYWSEPSTNADLLSALDGMLDLDLFESTSENLSDDDRKRCDKANAALKQAKPD